MLVYPGLKSVLTIKQLSNYGISNTFVSLGTRIFMWQVGGINMIQKLKTV